MNKISVPTLTAIRCGALYQIEEVILGHVAAIENWFRHQWRKTPPPITSSVDLRHAGFKLVPVDTNLFPAGFNNINSNFLPLCIQAVQSVLSDRNPASRNILLLPESHTRNTFYMQSVSVLTNIFRKAGFNVRIGSMDPQLTEPTKMPTHDEKFVLVESLVRRENRLGLADFDPCLILLNNDLSTGVPPILEGLEQLIKPSMKLGWSNRLKSKHFSFYSQIAHEFSELLGLDPWFIDPLFTAVDHVDFMAQEGIDNLADAADKLLHKISERYKKHSIQETPFVAVKADNGTYGMSVMMVQSGDELRQLNRKQRTKMAASKGSQKVTKVIIQEGVYSFETMSDGAVAEPVVYMIGPYVVGGFYRVHENRGSNENLNAPGMHFEQLAFTEPCNMPSGDLPPVECTNRFYVYGVIARLAALAAAREIADVEE